MKKLILLSLTLLLTASFVISGVTLAFFSDQESVGSSVFEMGRLSLTSVNTYPANEDPYTYVKNPSWTVQNTGTMNLNLRVKVVCQWAQTIKVETASEASSEAADEVTSERTNEATSETAVEETSEASSEAISETSSETSSEASSEASSEVANVLLIENDMQITNETEMPTGTELTTETQVVSKVKEVPTYVIKLTSDLWVQDGYGWYIYRYPVLPNESIQVDAEILVIDPEWEGALELYFEAEAQDVSSGGGYE